MLFGIRFSEHGDRYFAPEKPHVRICEGIGEQSPLSTLPVDCKRQA